MGFFSDIQEEARREARQSRYQTGQTEDAAPVQNIQSKGERKPETTQPAPTPMPEPKQPAPAVTPMDDGEVMAVEHQEFPVFGVQFHPESVMTPDGRKMVENFMQVVRGEA